MQEKILKFERKKEEWNIKLTYDTHAMQIRKESQLREVSEKFNISF